LAYFWRKWVEGEYRGKRVFAQTGGAGAMPKGSLTLDIERSICVGGIIRGCVRNREGGKKEGAVDNLGGGLLP